MTCLNDLNLGPTFNIRLFDTFKMYISEYAGTVLSEIQNLCWGDWWPNYILRVSKIRLLKIKLFPAGPASGLNRQAWSRASNFSLCSHLRDIHGDNRGLLILIFNSRTMLTRTIHTIVLFESTSGEVTRIRYPVTRITYLENFLCQTSKPSVLLKSFLHFALSCRRQCRSLYSNYMKMSIN